MHADEHKQQL
jgi:hypothetical protein